MYWAAIVGQQGTVIIYSLREEQVNRVIEKDADLIIFEAKLVTE